MKYGWWSHETPYAARSERCTTETSARTRQVLRACVRRSVFGPSVTQALYGFGPNFAKSVACTVTPSPAEATWASATLIACTGIESSHSHSWSRECCWAVEQAWA